MAQVIRSISDMQRIADGFRNSGNTLAVVPTMGSLHDGHLSLIRTARTLASSVITTVFVNPTQFGPGEDFERYPRDLERDVSLANQAGTDIVFSPDIADMFGSRFRTHVSVEGLTTILEGKSRPTHFRGVTTVVTKLLNITKPHVAVFGQKDAQQVVVIRQMVRDLNIDTEIVVVPIVREPDGLAMSSRNAYLSPDQRREAPVLFEALRQAQLGAERGERSAEELLATMRKAINGHSSGQIDYLSVAHGETLQELNEIVPGIPIIISLAVRFGSTRLIDNVQFSLGPDR